MFQFLRQTVHSFLLFYFDAAALHLTHSLIAFLLDAALYDAIRLFGDSMLLDTLVQLEDLDDESSKMGNLLKLVREMKTASNLTRLAHTGTFRHQRKATNNKMTVSKRPTTFSGRSIDEKTVLR